MALTVTGALDGGIAGQVDALIPGAKVDAQNGQIRRSISDTLVDTLSLAAGRGFLGITMPFPGFQTSQRRQRPWLSLARISTA